MMRNNKNEIYNYTIEKIHAMETKKILNRGKEQGRLHYICITQEERAKLIIKALK